jgi:hypothetical protein
MNASPNVSPRTTLSRPARRRPRPKSAVGDRKTSRAGGSGTKSRPPASPVADDCGPSSAASATRLWEALGSKCSAAYRKCRSLSRIPGEVAGRVDARLSAATGIELPWTGSLLTASGAAAGYATRRVIGRALSTRLHDRPGHWDIFADINAWMDQRRGRRHRIKHGHSPDQILELLRVFGPRAIPGYAVHIAQDFFTADGVPYLPYARCAAVLLRKAGLRGSVAAGLVTVNIDKVIAIYCLAQLGLTIGKAGYAVACQVGQRRKRQDKRIPLTAKARATA